MCGGTFWSSAPRPILVSAKCPSILAPGRPDLATCDRGEVAVSEVGFTLGTGVPTPISRGAVSPPSGDRRPGSGRLGVRGRHSVRWGNDLSSHRPETQKVGQRWQEHRGSDQPSFRSRRWRPSAPGCYANEGSAGLTFVVEGGVLVFAAVRSLSTRGPCVHHKECPRYDPQRQTSVVVSLATSLCISPKGGESQ